MVDPGDDLESTVEHLRDRVDDLESQLDQESQSPATATRRDALKAGGAGALLGALGLGSITSGASADPQGRLGSASDPVQQAYINEADVTALSADDQTINNSVTYPDGTTITTSPSAGSAGAPENVTSSRSRGQWYQNTTARPLYVSVGAVAGASGNDVQITLDVNDVESDNRVDQNRIAAATSESDRVTGDFVVPTGYYYRDRNLGDGSLDIWIEQER